MLGEWTLLREDIQLDVTPEGQEDQSFDHSWLFNKTDLADGPALIRCRLAAACPRWLSAGCGVRVHQDVSSNV